MGILTRNERLQQASKQVMDKQQAKKEREMESEREGGSIDIDACSRRREYKRSAERASEMATKKPRFNAIDME